jgi:hypothetical protein
MNALPGQLELATVIDHKPRLNTRPTHLGAVFDMPPEFLQSMTQQDTHKPAGVRLAKMLSQYDDSPSSQLWGDIQRLAREILK